MVLLTAIVWLRMYSVRIGEMRTRKINPQKLATVRDAVKYLQDTGAADNFRNLFEVPVLFYALVPVLLITGLASTTQLVLAWIYVVLRAAHSFIHVTYNRVMHRFIAYSLSTLILFAMWGMFAYAFITRT
jgi:hypothetical protein